MTDVLLFTLQAALFIASLLFQLALALVLLWVLGVFARAVQENHARGKARVHRGQSWQPRNNGSISPEPCPTCAAVGWHDQDCALLARLNAGQVSA